ncbi:hypothetical protein IIB50_02500 [Patescibacteria group bacterium]|nr:hypothetical protein [Patescibacteria group bacterium]
MKFNYKESSGITQQDIQTTTEQLSAYQQKLVEATTDGSYKTPESFLHLPYDKAISAAVYDIANKIKSDALKYIVVVGIGGSNLGARAIYDALYGHTDLLETNRYPKMIFADTNDSDFMSALQTLIQNDIQSSEEIAVVIISKSGETIETIANSEVVRSALNKRFENSNDRIIIITDESSKLWRQAEDENIIHLPIPSKVGGRFSVFSAAGLLPLALVNIDIEKLLLGARREENDSLISATLLYCHLQNGKSIHDMFVFHPELESLGKWYRQLAGESLGKKEEGMLPTVSVGSNDLHSVGQFYLAGPKNRVTTFVRSNDSADVIVPENTSLTQIMSAIAEGTKRVYTKKELPFMEIVLDSVSEESLGAFMQFKMREVLYLASLRGINAFNQPSVELYKEETRKLLK